MQIGNSEKQDLNSSLFEFETPLKLECRNITVVRKRPWVLTVNFCLHFTVTYWADEIMVGNVGLVSDCQHALTHDPRGPFKIVTHLTHLPMSHIDPLPALSLSRAMPN